MPLRYGNSKPEAYDSWVRFRLTTVVSAAAFDDPVFALRVGSPVTGFIERASIDRKSAPLTGWALASSSGGKLIRPLLPTPFSDG